MDFTKNLTPVYNKIIITIIRFKLQNKSVYFYPI